MSADIRFVCSYLAHNVGNIRIIFAKNADSRIKSGLLRCTYNMYIEIKFTLIKSTHSKLYHVQLFNYLYH